MDYLLHKLWSIIYLLAPASTSQSSIGANIEQNPERCSILFDFFTYHLFFLPEVNPASPAMSGLWQGEPRGFWAELAADAAFWQQRSRERAVLDRGSRGRTGQRSGASALPFGILVFSKGGYPQQNPASPFLLRCFLVFSSGL